MGRTKEQRKMIQENMADCFDGASKSEKYDSFVEQIDHMVKMNGYEKGMRDMVEGGCFDVYYHEVDAFMKKMEGLSEEELAKKYPSDQGAWKKYIQVCVEEMRNVYENPFGGGKNAIYEEWGKAKEVAALKHVQGPAKCAAMMRAMRERAGGNQEVFDLMARVDGYDKCGKAVFQAKGGAVEYAMVLRNKGGKPQEAFQILHDFNAAGAHFFMKQFRKFKEEQKEYLANKKEESNQARGDVKKNKAKGVQR